MLERGELTELDHREGAYAVDEVFFKDLLDNLAEGVYFVDTERRITYWNRGAEELTGYSAAEVVGRRCADGILVHLDCSGSGLCSEDTCPAAASMRDGGVREQQVFLHHKDGHRVPVLTRVSPIRNNGGSVVGAVEVFNDNSAVVAASEEIEQLRTAALLDPVTAIGNRRFGEHGLGNKLEEMRRYGWLVGALFFDIDNFKGVNDRHGHGVGDEILRMVAKTLSSNVRSFDLVCRWGGEEFLVLLSNITPDHLLPRAHALRIFVSQSCLGTGDRPIAVTVSVGATIAEHDDTPETLVERADQLMYESKSTGRNCVTVG